MRSIKYTLLALIATVALTGGPASANVCVAGPLTCATTMPLHGYCQCEAHGVTSDGTVMSKPTTSHKMNSTAGGCGTHPNATGCSPQ
jgi:hypothetical protein